jgi:hypothetical protein
MAKGTSKGWQERHDSTFAAAAHAGARHEIDDPRCSVCYRPMTCGQEYLNGGAHFVCDPPAGFYLEAVK